MGKNFLSKIFFILLPIISSALAVNIKNQKFQTLSKEQKECKIIEECRPCTFNELKGMDECQPTAYKKRIQCTVTNSEDQYYSEPCNENKKFNSVYILFIICIILFFCSYKYQKSQKDSTLKNVMTKLSILKE